jgi:AcrR family transcriptional regulator
MADLTEARVPRKYDGAQRRQQVAASRDRIVGAGVDLLLASSIRDWRALTIRAVAEGAGVSERTVYRQFGDQRGLRDAVMHRLEEEAGVDLGGLTLEDIAGHTTRVLEHVASYPLEPRPPLDPTLTDANQRQRQALLVAVAEHTAHWAEPERNAAAAMFDVLWSVGSYERLVVDWQIESDEAIRVIAWVIGLVQQAIREGDRPS